MGKVFILAAKELEGCEYLIVAFQGSQLTYL